MQGEIFLNYAKNRSVVLFSISTTLFFLIIGLYVLQSGHPHEDAYILYIYSEMLAENGVISYFSGGEPSEGATDFLWMLFISVLNMLGIPSGYGSLILNAAGVFLIAYLTFRVTSFFGNSFMLNVAISAFIPLYITSQAAYAGFSVALYSAMIALLFVISITVKGRNVVFVSLISLALALFRPDGAIIGIFFCFIFFYFTNKEERKIHLRGVLICAVIGIAYFIWRWNYFGHFLPLPLIVKSQSDNFLPGLSPNFHWATRSAIVISLAALALFSISKYRNRALAMGIPVLLYFLAIMFAVQSQNVSYRFQAPMAAILLVSAAAGLQYIIVQSQQWNAAIRFSVVSTLIIACSFQTLYFARQTYGLVRYLTNDDYINFFPYHLAPFVSSDTVLALTEAGRFAYWLPGKKYDLVGLNTARTAIEGASKNYLESLEPDLIFFHHAGTLPSINCTNDRPYCEINTSRFREIVVSDDTLLSLASANRVRLAPAAIAEYLTTTEVRYQIFAVRYGSTHSHLYALREDGSISKDSFLTSLDLSYLPEGQLSYSEMTLGNSINR